ncbi:MAG: hypothetical protein KDA89_24110 [Planctomycetaceae bacterium]|nr:hypothetical protein [Planctomycetaceae bacterium]
MAAQSLARTARRLTCLTGQLYRGLWLRQLPHGLVSLRYLLPGQDDRVCRHAELWRQSRGRTPLLIWLLAELWLWFRWVTISGWLSCLRVMRHRGDWYYKRHGISQWRQWRTLVRLSIGCCVPPIDVYRFSLFRNPDRVWNYVFDHEIHAYHRRRNGHRGSGKASRELLADKYRHAEVLAETGIPTAPILACVSGNSRQPISEWLTPKMRLFCKTRSGNCGFGAFTAWRTDDIIQGRKLSGEHLPDAEAVNRAWLELLNLDDALVQPALLNHPQLAPLAVGDDAITVRYITRREGTVCDCLNASLEVPAGHDEHGRPLYVILPIEPETGVLRSFPQELIRDGGAAERQAAVVSRIAPNQAVPDWPVIAAGSRRAHQTVSDLWAVAWDWVVTPDGVCLLEGNSGWGAAIPQMLQGGFLQGDEACPVTADAGDPVFPCHTPVIPNTRRTSRVRSVS